MWKKIDSKKLLEPINMVILGLLIVLISILFISAFLFGKYGQNRLLSSSIFSIDQFEEEKNNPFDEIEIMAKSVHVWDIKNNNEIFEINSEEKRPIASITKIMTAIVAYKNTPNEIINIEREFLEPEGDTGLFLDELWNLKDLTIFSLLTSSNDGAFAIASVSGSKMLGINDFIQGRKHFIKKMNEKAEIMGLENTLFKNESGLDEDEYGGKAGAYSTAKDVSKLMEHAVLNYPEILYKTGERNVNFVSLSGIFHTAENTNIETGKISSLLASKTGFTDLAGGNLTIVFDPLVGRPIVITVLGSTIQDRFGDVLKLTQSVTKYLENEKIE